MSEVLWSTCLLGLFAIQTAKTLKSPALAGRHERDLHTALGIPSRA